MVIELSTAFSMRCSDCGHLEINQVNVFQILDKKSIYCDCGNKKCTIKRKGSKYVEITYYCIICDYEHSVIITQDKFWATHTYNAVECPNTNLNVGYYGSYKLINKVLKKQQEELDAMANELGFDDFDNPEVMLEVLDYLHDMAARGDLFCDCGSRDIYIDLASKKVKLTCGYCNTSIVIPASSKEDLSNLKNLKKVELKVQSGNPNNISPWINI